MLLETAINPKEVRPYFTEKKTYVSNRLRAEELAIKYHQVVRDLKNGQVWNNQCHKIRKVQEMVRTFEDKLESAPLDEEWPDRLNEANESVQGQGIFKK